MALIELDLDAPPAPASSRPPARYLRYLAACAAAVLGLALGGAAPSVAVRWQRAGLVPLAGASTSVQLLGGLLYTMDGNASRRTTTAWSTHPLRRLWSVSTDLQLDPSGTVIHDSGATLAQAAPFTLQTSATTTTIIDPRDGAVRWSSPAPLAAHSGGVGIVQDATFAAGSVYDQSSGDPGSLYWSADGVPHTQPPLRTVLHGHDLATGRELWTVEEPGSVYVVPTGGDATGFVVITAERLLRLATDTGAVLQERDRPRFPGRNDSFPEVVGDLVIMRHFLSDTGGDTATAFGLDTLEQRWRVDEAAETGNTGNCLGLACHRDAGAVVVLDPRDGTARWRTQEYVDLMSWGSEVLETGATGGRPLRLLDLRTGQVKVDLRGWDSVAYGAGDTPIVLVRAEPGTGRDGFGVLTPGASRVRRLGLAAGPVRECSADDRVVACRVDAGVEVWSYRA